MLEWKPFFLWDAGFHNFFLWSDKKKCLLWCLCMCVCFVFALYVFLVRFDLPIKRKLGYTCVCVCVHEFVCVCMCVCVCVRERVRVRWVVDFHCMPISRCQVLTCQWARSGTTCWLFWSVEFCTKLAMLLLLLGDLIRSLYASIAMCRFISVVQLNSHIFCPCQRWTLY